MSDAMHDSSARDPATNQLHQYHRTATTTPTLTTSNGAPVESLTASLTAGHRRPTTKSRTSTTVGTAQPIALQDFALLDHLSHFDRERIPERVVHAKGAGASGYFRVHEPNRAWLQSICRAALFQLPQNVDTPVRVRFSTVGGESGSADTARDPRGFAVKFFTPEGVWDLVGNNTPVFFIRDPILFPSFIHTQKRNPQTNLKDPDAFWDFIGLRPETIHQVSFLFADRGIPDGYRHMNGYGSHTFRNVNANGEAVYVKYHFKTDQGIRNLDAATADRLASTDPDYATRDLYNAIARDDCPSWTMYVQVMTYAQAAACSFDPFDVTKVWPHAEYPLHEAGRLVLNENPVNYFADIEQLAFSPSHLVPGIEPSPDKMLQARLFSYPDTQRHRLGTNYQQLPCNAPPPSGGAARGQGQCPVMHAINHYQRDGPMQFSSNGGGGPNYYPNSFSGAVATGDATTTPMRAVNTTDTVHGSVTRMETGQSEDNIGQCTHFYTHVLDEGGRVRLTANLASHLSGAQPRIRDRVLQTLTAVHPDYANRVRRNILLASSNGHIMTTTTSSSSSSTTTAAAPLNPPRVVPKSIRRAAAGSRGHGSRL